MQRTITYLYPNMKKASSLKVFQDRTNQIRAFYFTRENIKEVEKLESGTNYAVYFLFNEADDDGLTKVYIGQSTKGANRMLSHEKEKSFWSYCIMFVTDNNSFDAMSIDYMEYHFINKLKNSSTYSLENTNVKSEPVVSIFDKPNLKAYIEQIEFLLKAEGIDFSEQLVTVGSDFYYPRNKNYHAKVSIKEGIFVLHAGSIINMPIESSKHWADQGRFYNRYSEMIRRLLNDGKITSKENAYETLVNLTFKSPSTIASLVSGRAENGWLFFEGLNDLRNIN
ncbi:MAG: GIY-YIG nuclease family protein [Tissierellaceae bacterium]|jgi:hypothetical protein